jgi:hypothetical protein
MCTAVEMNAVEINSDKFNDNALRVFTALQ